MSTRLDIIVFGATGFTGQYTLPYVYKLTKEHGRNLTWGIAGRSQEKLREILMETARKVGENDLNFIPIIIANINDEQSLKQMTAQAKVLVNCCGPYLVYGEAVVKSCIETGTHHVDVSGESLFVESTEFNYFQAAKDKGVYVVTGCGFHSLPTDLAVGYLENNFEGTLNSMEVYIHVYEEGGWTIGPRIRQSTWLSIVTNVGNYGKLGALRKKLYPKRLPNFKPKLTHRALFHKPKMFDKWAIPFAGSDCDVMSRSQRYFYEHHNKRPVQTYCYALLDSFKFVAIALFMFIFFGVLGYLVAQCKCGTIFMLKHPKLFCLKFFSYEDPTEDELERHRYTFTLIGKGWDEKLPNVDDKFKGPPNKTIMAQISGANPGYGITCVAVVLSAIVILTEPEKLPPRGGVYTTAAAFNDTTMISQLQENGVSFKILPNDADGYIELVVNK